MGQSRAAAATALLQELNDAVAGSFVDEAPDALLAANPRFLADFSLVIATQARSASCPNSWPLVCVVRQACWLAICIRCLITSLLSTARHAGSAVPLRHDAAPMCRTCIAMHGDLRLLARRLQPLITCCCEAGLAAPH